jgi:outer membrane lipoprotein
MKKILLLVLLILLISCAPVFKKEIMETAQINIPLSKIKQELPVYRDKVFILGGLIVSTKITEKGSLIEAINIPVDSLGRLKDLRLAEGRFLAIMPYERGFLDPLIYKQGRFITVAGRLIEIKTGRIDEIEYHYPLFEIIDIHLWEERKEYIVVPPYYPYWDHPYWYDPWWRRYPYPPWWW